MRSTFHVMRYANAIVHIDGDAFFASCEQALHPELKNKPVITGKERGIASSMSYEAKGCGVKRGMMLSEIRKLCPSAIIVPSDYESYSLFSKRMFAIMRRFTADVEEYSIDEAFANLTGMQGPFHKSYEAIAREMKATIDRELGFTVSVGLAPSKTLAKVGSKWKKPNGFTAIPGNEIKKFLSKLKVEDVWGIGPAISAYMNKLRIYTALDFINKPLEWVMRNFTKPHIECWRELRGEMVWPVDTEMKHDYQSISKTKTFTPPSSNREFIFAQLVKNLENACIKLRRHNLVSKKITIFLKTQDFRFRGIEFDLSSASAWPSDISALLEKSFTEIFDPALFYRATGIIATNIQEDQNIQCSLFDSPLKLTKMRSIYSAVDALSEKYGKHTVRLCSSLNYKSKISHPLPTSLHSAIAQDRLSGRGRRIIDRHDIPGRQKIRLRGERGRQRLAIPLIQRILR